jgi:hypothetical protein
MKMSIFAACTGSGSSSEIGDALNCVKNGTCGIVCVHSFHDPTVGWPMPPKNSAPESVEACVNHAATLCCAPPPPLADTRFRKLPLAWPDTEDAPYASNVDRCVKNCMRDQPPHVDSSM